jgi:hypothetical protein
VDWEVLGVKGPEKKAEVLLSVSGKSPCKRRNKSGFRRVLKFQGKPRAGCDLYFVGVRMMKVTTVYGHETDHLWSSIW